MEMTSCRNEIVNIT